MFYLAFNMSHICHFPYPLYPLRVLGISPISEKSCVLFLFPLFLKITLVAYLQHTFVECYRHCLKPTHLKGKRPAYSAINKNRYCIATDLSLFTKKCYSVS